MIYTKEQIVERLNEGTPVSIVRVGDGEGIILNSQKSYQTARLACDAVLKRQTGLDLSMADLEAIRSNLVSTYTNCDIIGLPFHKQETSGHWTKIREILADNAPDYISKDICDIDVAYQLLENDGYDALLQDRPVLNYIGCRDLDEGFRNKWNIKVVNQYLISPEAKFTSGYEGDPHWPTQFNRCARWLDVMAERRPGSLLFVGAGVIGKIYCNWWRDRGGVAFDVGGCMDVWAGRITRGKDRGLDVIDPDPKYKIV